MRAVRLPGSGVSLPRCATFHAPDGLGRPGACDARSRRVAVPDGTPPPCRPARRRVPGEPAAHPDATDPPPVPARGLACTGAVEARPCTTTAHGDTVGAKRDDEGFRWHAAPPSLAS